MADGRYRPGSWVNRYLNKVFSVQASIDKLLHFSFSRSFRPYLATGITLRINVVKSDVRPIAMPRTAKEWDCIVGDMAKLAPVSLSRNARAALCENMNRAGRRFGDLVSFGAFKVSSVSCIFLFVCGRIQLQDVYL